MEDQVENNNVAAPSGPKCVGVFDDWCRLVGQFILNFSVLEERVWSSLQQKLPPDEFERIAKKQLADAVRLLGSTFFVGGESEVRFAAFDARLKPIREFRNHVAHGHFFVQLHKGASKAVLTLRQSRDVTSIDSSDRPLSIDDLLAENQKLADLIDEFTALADLSQAVRVFGPKYPPP